MSVPTTQLNVLALEPYYGGSHQAFLDGWRGRSRHAWTLLTLPAYWWKWRMRHAAVTFARQLADADPPPRPDVLVCSDMLNLAELKGLTPHLAGVPAVVYFHENQLTYPVRRLDPRDVHFGLTNVTTALAADAVWFNSAYNRDSFLAAVPELLAKMPDRRLADAAGTVAARSSVHPPGIDIFTPRPPREPGPIRIGWAARWEHDKDPDTFFAAVRALAARGGDFRLSVVGQQFRDAPPVFAAARDELADRIDHWGYQPTRDAYRAVLAGVDVFVSTARHEFFGLAAAEAVAAGAYPLLPERLAYPELLQLPEKPEMAEFFHDGSPAGLADRLAALARRADLWLGDADRARRVVRRFSWDIVAPALDHALAALV